jgi:DNA-binding NtrC family response regulator
MASNLLIVDDDPDQALVLAEVLREAGIDSVVVHSGEQALSALATDAFDAVLADVHLGSGINGLDLCAAMRRRGDGPPLIAVTGAGNLETAVAALRAGAYDFITKPVANEALHTAVSRALEHARRVQEGRPKHGLFGSSVALKRVIETVGIVAQSDATVLITGESGTGKELVSRAIHDLGPRRDARFVAINCAAVSPNLLESELFGHVIGAFTDAKQDRPGLFVQADGGTLFLDEIGEMPLEMQVKLLRVLQERIVRPIGGDQDVRVDVRVVCATHRDLDAEVAAKRFRGDLFYRINVVGVRVPPLRDRGNDIIELAGYFLRRIARRAGRPAPGLSLAARQLLLAYTWPGNVRELENCMERAFALSREDRIGVDDLPDTLRAAASVDVAFRDAGSDFVTIGELERRYTRKVVEATGGNKARAARILGIDRRSLYRRLEEPAGDEPPS